MDNVLIIMMCIAVVAFTTTSALYAMNEAWIYLLRNMVYLGIFICVFIFIQFVR